MEIHVQDLIGRQVVDPSGKAVGRIEEIAAERRGAELFVTEYHIGPVAMLERVASATIIRGMLGGRGLRGGKGLRVPWDILDLKDVHHPKLTCAVSSLPPSKDGED